MPTSCHLLLIWLGILLTGPAIAAPAMPAATSRAIHQLAQRVDELARHPEIAGLAVAVVSPELVLYQQVHGVREHGRPQPVDARTRFRIASLSKGFASTLTAMLVADGQLAWDDRVIDDVDYFTLRDPAQARAARLEHLLSQRVGLPHNAYDRLLEANWKPVNIVQRYERVKLICPVGTCYGYQNITYNLVAEIIAARTGVAFDQQLRQRIFEPLQMTSAGLGSDHLTQDDNYARPHVRVRSGVRPVDVKSHYYRLPASAGVNLTLDDMVTWVQAQLGAWPDVLDEQLLAQLRQPYVETRREFSRGGWRGRRLRNAWYGLGWRIYDYQGHPMIYHAGAVEGYRAQIAILPDLELAVAVMWNSESGKPWGVVPVFADALFGLPDEDWMKLRLTAP